MLLLSYVQRLLCGPMFGPKLLALLLRVFFVVRISAYHVQSDERLLVNEGRAEISVLWARMQLFMFMRSAHPLVACLFLAVMAK